MNKINDNWKKRIYQEEYNKKNKQMIDGAGEPIVESDIMYQDDLVCILILIC